MNTFFDKLTGLPKDEGDIAPTVELAATKEALRNSLRKNMPSAHTAPSHHLKVEEKEKEGEPAKEEAEEEGELTVDIYDRGDSIIVQSTVAGVKPEDLDISITNDMVTIRGSRELQEEVTDDAYYYKELFWGIFSRSVLLPEEIEEDMAEANLKHGLLTIRLPKKKKGVVQKLKVKVT